MDEAHQLVAAYCPRKIINHPVTIKIVAFYKDKRRRDPDNVFAKGLIDGLKGIAIEDDDSRFVKEVTLQVFTGQKDDHVEIILGALP